MTTYRFVIALFCLLAASCTLEVKNGETDVEWGSVSCLEDEDLDDFDEAATCFDRFPRPLDTYVSWEHGGVKRWASGTGTVTFGADDRSVQSLGPGAVLWVGEERDGVMREVRFLASEFGQPRVIHEVSRVEREWDADARAWFAGLVPDVVRHAEVGARQRAARLLREGAEKLLVGFRELATAPPRAIYLDALLSVDELDADQVAAALEACDGELGRSGMQHTIYRRLAERFPDSARMHAALMDCSERTMLSQDRFDAQRALLGVWRKGALQDAALEQRWIAACAGCEPKAWTDLLLELVACAPGGDRSRIAALHAARDVPSSVLRSSVVERCAKLTPASDELLLAVVEEIVDLESSARREALLLELLEREKLTAPVLDATGDAAKGLESPAAERRVLSRLSDVRAAS